jgi:hypothetical protein
MSAVILMGNVNGFRETWDPLRPASQTKRHGYRKVECGGWSNESPTKTEKWSTLTKGTEFSKITISNLFHFFFLDHSL